MILLTLSVRGFPAVSVTVNGILTDPNEVNDAVVVIESVRVFPDPETDIFIPVGRTPRVNDATLSSKVRV
jgi:hypothetical protein